MWSTDKDGIIMDLLAAEMMARTGKDPAQLYQDLTGELGAPVYERIDAAATQEQKATLSKLAPDQVKATELAGDKIVAMMTSAPGNGAAIGGLKVVTEQGWFRRSSFRNRRCVQTVCGKLSRERSPQADSGRRGCPRGTVRQ